MTLAGPMGIGHGQWGRRRGHADHALLTDHEGFNATELQDFRCNHPAMCNGICAKAVRA
jgi:hypothetical protein